jgi:hypothetical protein
MGLQGDMKNAKDSRTENTVVEWERGALKLSDGGKRAGVRGGVVEC